MKLLISILNDADYFKVSGHLEKTDYVISKIDSTGGFLREGKTTLMLGIPDKEVDRAIELIQHYCSPSVNPLKKKATLMVLNVEHFEQI